MNHHAKIRNPSVNTLTEVRDRRQGKTNTSPKVQRFRSAPLPVWPTQRSIQSPSQNLSPGGKRPERDADHSSSHSDNVQNASSYTATPQSSPGYGTYWSTSSSSLALQWGENWIRISSPVYIVGVPLCYMMQYLDTRGEATVNHLISFSGNIITIIMHFIYRVIIKSFPDYKHLLQENYVEYKTYLGKILLVCIF
jgi:hypothetical protein